MTEVPTIYRSSRLEMFCEKDVLRNFTKFRPATLLKKRFWHRCFPVNFAKFLRAPFFKEHFRRLLPHIETSPLIYSANQWTGFYMVETFITKELKLFFYNAFYYTQKALFILEIFKLLYFTHFP